MGALENFTAAIELLRNKIETYETDRGDVHVTEAQDAKDAEVMSNPNNWCCVHTTRYMPQYDQNGNMIITSTAMVADGEVARNTVHLTLNNGVEDNSGGVWADCGYVILVPYQDVVAKNGAPVGICLTDTYFSVDVDTGLVLPKDSAYLIQPSNNLNDELYVIGEHGATYKSANFTDDEVKTILSMVDSAEIDLYNQLMSGGDRAVAMWLWDRQNIKVKKQYESAADKKVFLRDLILMGFMRNIVTRMVMEQKGFTYIKDAPYRAGTSQYNSQVAKAIEDVAISKNIDTTAERHANSVYGTAGLQTISTGFGQAVNRLISEQNMDNLFAQLLSILRNEDPTWIIDVVTKNVFPNDYYKDVYEPKFLQKKADDLKFYNVDCLPEYRDRYGYMYKRLEHCETIEDFDPKLAKALRRQVETNIAKLRKWRSQMEHNPKFQKLLEKWDDFINDRYDDADEFFKPSIEQQFAQPHQMMHPREM